MQTKIYPHVWVEELIVAVQLDARLNARLVAAHVACMTAVEILLHTNILGDLLQSPNPITSTYHQDCRNVLQLEHCLRLQSCTSQMCKIFMQISIPITIPMNMYDTPVRGCVVQRQDGSCKHKGAQQKRFRSYRSTSLVSMHTMCMLEREHTIECDKFSL